MKKNFLLLLLLSLFQNVSFSQNIVGSYQHTISRVMGGYRISSTSNLDISKNEKQTLSYFVTTTVVDEYNGGAPRTEETSGVVKLIGNKYKFVGGSYGERGAYLLTNNKINTNVIIYFAPSRGDAMRFDRQ